VIVTTEKVSKWYGQVSGLNDVTVTVPAGITGLLGPNGAGKSTFMKLITGQLKPSKGVGAGAWRADLGQPGALCAHGLLSGAGRVLRADDRHRLGDRAGAPERIEHRRRASRAERALTAVDLMEAANKKIGAYSKGMRQRVKLAQAIVHDPDLLILDEPLTGMDPIMRRRTIRQIKDWAKRGRASSCRATSCTKSSR
jgi:ABC-2 type transport system ATP-binding protein